MIERVIDALASVPLVSVPMIAGPILIAAYLARPKTFNKPKPKTKKQ